MFTSTGAYSGFAVDDLARAAAFYADVLGVRVERDDGRGLMALRLGSGAVVLVYERPHHVPATHTVLNFPVDDVAAAVDDLAGRGVRFGRYDGFAQDERGGERGDEGPPIAWFTDPAGNVLAVLEEQPGS